MTTRRIRQYELNGNGMKATKIKHVTGELGTGLIDSMGQEIFERDVVRLRGENLGVRYFDGTFFVGNYPLYEVADEEMEIVGYES